jgi:P-type E1-E2 ATPase
LGGRLPDRDVGIADRDRYRRQVAIVVSVPGSEPLELEHVVLDVNGTLAHRGVLIDGVAERIARLREQIGITIASADTFGTVHELAARLGVDAHVVASGTEKAALVERVGAVGCVAIGNGANDVPMLERAALAIAVLGPEGASAGALAAADVVCRSAIEALDLLLDPRALVATLRP